MLARVFSCAVIGLEGVIVEVEVDYSNGLPAVIIVGLPDAAVVLWTKFLKHDPKDPHWPDRDRFVLSAGHGSMLQYALLYLSGFEDMTLDELKRFRQLGAKTAGH